MRQQRGFSFLFFLFGLIFFSAGMLVGYIALSQVYQWHKAKSWEQVPMTILTADLEVSHDDDSTTYAAVAVYRYEYQGQQYENDRVSFSGGSDNIGSFHEDTYDLLQEHVNGEPFIGYVNPEDPEKSVLIRDMRWGLFGFMLVFPLAFGGAGGGIMAFAIISGSGRKRKQSKKMPQEQPVSEFRQAESPALDKWESNRIECSNQGQMWLSIFFAFIWNVISMPIVFFVPGEFMETGEYMILLAFIFPIVGIGLIIWAVRSIMRWRRYGRSAFNMDPFPAHPGGIVRGVLELHKPLEQGAESMQVTLSCINRRTTGSGKNRSTREYVLWQDQQSVSLRPGQQRVEFGFRLEDDAKLTDNSNSRDNLLWRLDCGAQIPGVDFIATFELPVVDGQPDEQTRREAEKMTRHREKQALASDAWKQTGVQTAIDGGYPQYLFPAGRNKTMVAILALFAVVFGGVGFGCMFAGGLWLFGGIFAAVGLLTAWGTLYYLLYSCEFTVRPDGLEVTSGMLIKKTRRYPAFSIQSIELGSGAQVNSKRYWDVVMKTAPSTSTGYSGYKKQQGQTVKLATDIADRRAAESLIARIHKQLGLDSP